MKIVLTAIAIFGIVSGAEASSKVQVGVASWYGSENYISSSGKRLLRKVPAAAHKTFPLGSKIKITSHKTKKTVIAIVDDRGPYCKGRIVDVNQLAAAKLGILKCGISKVSVELL